MRKTKIERLEISGKGNTEPSPRLKQGTQYIKWCFTFNNPTEENIRDLEREFLSIGQKWIYGKECGESGTPHLQGGLWLKSKKRITELKYLGEGKIHWEHMINAKATENYCKKEGDWIKGGNWQEEEKEYEGEGLPKEKDLYPWEIKLLSELEVEADDRKIIWIWEDIGKVGKTKFSKYLCYHKKAAYCQKGKYTDIMNYCYMIKNLNIFIIDVPRSSGNNVSYNALEAIKSGMISNMKYETGLKLIPEPHVVVFANKQPNTEELSKDRWDIRKINENLDFEKWEDEAEDYINREHEFDRPTKSELDKII